MLTAQPAAHGPQARRPHWSGPTELDAAPVGTAVTMDDGATITSFAVKTSSVQWAVFQGSPGEPGAYQGQFMHPGRNWRWL